jgi:hypothetical protein
LRDERNFMTKKIIFVLAIAAIGIVPTFTQADLGSLVGDTCLVPIFHTQFAFPPEGGQIIRGFDGQMYFVRTYLPGCANAGSSGTLISSGSTVNTFPSNQQTTTTTTYYAPQTGRCR